jgi:hypothetical protein
VSSSFRIERVAPDRLRLFRDGCLVDEDVELDDDSLADIERWGSEVAWAEEYTGIAQWDAQPGGDQWQVLIGVAYRYVRWQVEDRTVWDEVGPDGWVSRHVEVGPDGRYLAAARVSEVLAARDTGDVSAVTTYERVYGIVPETGLGPEAEPYLTPVSGREFIERWMAARHALEPNSGSTQ